MATVRSNIAIDEALGNRLLPEQTSTYSNQSDTAFSFTTASTSNVVSGRGFTYAPNGTPQAGTVTSINAFSGPAQLVTVSDLNVTIADVAALSLGDRTAALAALLNGSDLVNGSDAADTVGGFSGDDTLLGFGGSDVIYGSRGNDVEFGNQGSDTLYGGQGMDTLYGGQDADALIGNFDADQLFGNRGDDTLFGGQGGDTLYGGQGSDILSGDLGDDVLSGDLGADRYVFGQTSGNDLILGFDSGEGDRIVLQGQTYTTGATASGSALLNLSGGGTVELRGIQASAVNASFFV